MPKEPQHSVEQPSHLRSALQQGGFFIILGITQTVGNLNMSFQFGKRTFGDAQELYEFRPMLPSLSFRDIGGNRNCGTL